MFKFLRARGAQLATVILLLQAGVYYSISRTEVIPPTPPWSEFPSQVGKWVEVGESAIDAESLAKLQPDDYIDRTYDTPGGARVYLFVAYFKTQRKGLAPHSPKACLPGAGWAPVSSDVINLPVPGHPIPVNLFLVEKQQAKMQTLYWYQQEKESYAGELTAQFHALPQLLTHGRTDIAIVRIIVPVTSTVEIARNAAERFALDAYPLIMAHIP